MKQETILVAASKDEEPISRSISMHHVVTFHHLRLWHCCSCGVVCNRRISYSLRNANSHMSYTSPYLTSRAGYGGETIEFHSWTYKGLHGIPEDTELMRLAFYIHIPDWSHPILSCCCMTSKDGQKWSRKDCRGDTSSHDKLSNHLPRRKIPPNSTPLVISQGGLPKLSLASCRQQCVTKWSWKN